MVRSLRHALYGLVTFLGVIAVGVVLAQAAPATPISITPTGVSGGSLMTAVTYRAPAGVGAANMGYFTRPVPISPATLGGLARGIMSRSAPALAVAATVAAAGWAFNALQQEFQIPGQPGTPLGPTSWRFDRNWSGSGPPSFVYASTPSGLVGVRILVPPGNNTTLTVTSTRLTSSSSGEAIVNGGPASGDIVLVQTPAGARPVDETAPQPVPLAQVGQAMLANPQTWQPLLTNSDGSPVRTPEVMNEAAALGTLIAQGANTTQLGQAGWDAGNQGGEPAPSSPAAEPFELPAFCAWATVVCEFFGWYQEAEVPDDGPSVPEEELDALRVPWSSGWGGGACPADVSTTVMNDWEVVFPMQPLCSVADLLRPLLILLAAIVSLYIIIGGTRAT